MEPAEAQALLEARARALARPLQPPAATGSLLQLVSFHSGPLPLALESRFVRQVLRSTEPTPLPGAPPLLRGLVLLRGEVLPVVELAPLFGQPAPALRPGPLLVVGTGHAELVLATASVEEVRSLPRSELLPPPPALAPQEGSLLAGVSPQGLLVLEGSALLADERLFFDLGEGRSP